MAETRAYITHEAEDRLLLTIREDCTLYSMGTAIDGLSWAFRATDDERWRVFSAQPGPVFEDADEILAEHGWKREKRWAVGDVTTGTYASVTRA